MNDISDAVQPPLSAARGSSKSSPPAIVAGLPTEPAVVAGLRTEPAVVAGLPSELAVVAGLPTEPAVVAGLRTELAVVAGLPTELAVVAGLPTELAVVAGLPTEPHRPTVGLPDSQETSGHTSGGVERPAPSEGHTSGGVGRPAPSGGGVERPAPSEEGGRPAESEEGGRPAPSGSVPSEGRLLGLDYGTRRIGVAVCDDRQIIASPLETYTRSSEEADRRFLMRLVSEYRIVGIVVGLPVHMSGDEGGKAAEARSFGAWVSQVTARPVAYWDERFTSSLADDHLRAAGVRPGRRKDLRDKLAAQMILQSFIDSRDRTLRPPPLR